MPLSAQQSLKRPPEVGVEHRVDDRIEGRVHVPQPRDEVYHVLRDVARLAEGQDDVHGEEREPAEDEHPHDDAEDLGGSSLLLETDAFFLFHVAPHGHGGGGIRCRFVYFVFLGRGHRGGLLGSGGLFFHLDGRRSAVEAGDVCLGLAVRDVRRYRPHGGHQVGGGWSSTPLADDVRGCLGLHPDPVPGRLEYLDVHHRHDDQGYEEGTTC